MSSESKEELPVNGESDTVTESENKVIESKHATKDPDLQVTEAKDVEPFNCKNTPVDHHSPQSSTNGEIVQVNGALIETDEISTNLRQVYSEEKSDSDSPENTEEDAELAASCNKQISNVSEADTDLDKNIINEETNSESAKTSEQNLETLSIELKKSIVENVFSRYVNETKKPRTDTENADTALETKSQDSSDSFKAAVNESSDNAQPDASAVKEAQTTKDQLQENDLAEKEPFNDPKSTEVFDLNENSPGPAKLCKIVSNSEHEHSECNTAGDINTIDVSQKECETILECPHLEPEVPMELEFSQSLIYSGDKIENSDDTVKCSEVPMEVEASESLIYANKKIENDGFVKCSEPIENNDGIVKCSEPIENNDGIVKYSEPIENNDGTVKCSEPEQNLSKIESVASNSDADEIKKEESSIQNEKSSELLTECKENVTNMHHCVNNESNKCTEKVIVYHEDTVRYIEKTESHTPTCNKENSNEMSKTLTGSEDTNNNEGNVDNTGCPSSGNQGMLELNKSPEPLSNKPKGQKLDELLSKIATKANIPKKAKARKTFSHASPAIEKAVVSNLPVTPASITNLTFNVKMLEKQGVLDIPKIHNKRKAFEPFKLKVKQSDNVEKSPVKMAATKSPVKSPKDRPFFNTNKVIKGRRRKKKKMGSYKLPSEKKQQKAARERKKASEERQVSDDEKSNKNRDLHTKMDVPVNQDKMDISLSKVSHTDIELEQHRASPLSQTSAKSIENEPRTEAKHQNALDILTKNSNLPSVTSSDTNLKKAKKSVHGGQTRTLDAYFKRVTNVAATASESSSPISDKSGGAQSHESQDSVVNSGVRKRKVSEETGQYVDKTPPDKFVEGQEEKKRKTEIPVGISPPPPMMILTGSPPLSVPARPLIPTPISISTSSPVTFTQLTSPNSKQQPKTIIQNGTLNGMPVFQIISNGSFSPGQLVAIGTQGQQFIPGSLSKTAILQSPPRLPGAAPGMPVILTPVAVPTVVSSGVVTSLQNQVSLLARSSGGSINIPNKSIVSPINSSNLATTMNPVVQPIAAPIPLSVFSQSIIPSTQTSGHVPVLNHISKSSLEQNTLKPTNIPNGLYPVTPPRTPDDQAESDTGSQASVGVSPGQQVSPEKDIIPLCTCKLNGASFPKLVASVTYCQALDSVDNKAMGCCNKVTNSQLVRPAVKIPFMAVCEHHRKRLKLHQCCPGCGHFCTQGKFQQCRNEGNQIVHNFHEQCQVIKDGKNYCPHCGEASAQVEVTLRLQEKKPPSLESKSSRIQTKAKMAVPDKKSGGSGDESSEETVVVLEKSKKTLSTADIPFGPDRHSLERVLSSLAQERPKKYRHLPKCLFTPAYDNDLERVVYMLEDGHDPNEKYDDLEGQGAIHAAAIVGSLPIVHILIQAGASPHLQDKTLRTPLMFASENNHHQVVKYLLKVGSVIDSKSDDGMTSLHYAAKAGHVGIIKILLDVEGIDIDVKDDGGYTPLIWAAEHEQLEVVKYLLKRDADPNLRDSEENTALHWAAFSGSANVAEVLLNAGCELDSLNMHGDSPLHIASRQDHYECVVLFLARGADVELKNNKGETPVECCIDINSSTHLALRVNKQLKGFGAKYMGRPEKLLCRDISKGRENIPIPCVNAIDDDGIPTDYLYVTDNVETKCLNVNRVIGSLQSCQCKDDCSSIYCACGKSSVKCWYDKFGRLLPEFNMLEPSLIFECNRACECWTTCNNRVVQNGVMSRLQVFKTEGRGWGCKTLVNIPRGTFICEYIGEHISDHEADKREDDSYLFDLDNKDGETYCIDARKYGNVARFINHLCEPNLVPVKVFVDSQDLRFPRICLFASRDILAQEELGFDYGEKFWIIKWKHFTCTCGSPKCRYSKETIQRTLEEYRLRHEEDIETTQE